MWRNLLPDVFALDNEASESPRNYTPIPDVYEKPDMLPDLAKLELRTSIRRALDQVQHNDRGDSNPPPFSAVLVHYPNNLSTSIGVTCLQINRRKSHCDPVCTLKLAAQSSNRCKPEIALILNIEGKDEQFLLSELPGYLQGCTFSSLAPLMPTARILSAVEQVTDRNSFASKLLQRTNQYMSIEPDNPTQHSALCEKWQDLNFTQVQVPKRQPLPCTPKPQRLTRNKNRVLTLMIIIGSKID